jgi:hypothetical protein
MFRAVCESTDIDTHYHSVRHAPFQPIASSLAVIVFLEMYHRPASVFLSALVWVSRLIHFIVPILH